MARSPGSTAPIQVRGSGMWAYTAPSGGTTTSVRDGYVLRDYRPSYLRGNRSTIGSTHWIFPTGYSHKSRTIDAPGQAVARQIVSGKMATCTETNPPIDTKLNQNGFIVANDATLMYPLLKNAATVKALNSIADQKANIAEDLATYAQTARMFSNKAQALRDILDAFKKDKRVRNHARRNLREVASKGDKVAAQAYLEYVYGWKPLVSDVFGAYQLLKDYSTGKKAVIVHGHGSSSQQEQTSFQDSYPSTVGGNWIKNQSSTKVRTRCDLYGRVDPNLVAWRMLNQLGLLNPLSFAWELTPWSFVVDWFIPVGPVLNALTAPIGLNFISGTVGERVSRTHVGEYHVQVIQNHANMVEDTPINYTVTDELYVRQTLPNWPFPLPWVDLNPLRGDRSFKALALAIVNLR